jgi:drug/metabolite transporter (DMT)-like permease
MTPPLKAALWMIGAIFSFTAMAVAAREISQTHDSFEIMAARSVIGLVFVLVIGKAVGQLGHISTQRLSGHFWRNIVHFTAQNLWFWSLTMIPLAQVFALEFTSPLWVILLSPLFLGERLTRSKLAAAGLGFAGILIVARPDLTNLSPGVLAAAGSALGFAATSILTKRLTRDEAIITILFWLTAFQAVFGILAATYDGQVNWPTAETLPWLGLIGVCGVLAHLSLTSALTLAPASFVMPIDFIRLPLIAVIGAMAYGEAIDPFVLGGGVVIFLGIWISIRAELRQKTGQTPTSIS